MEDKIEQAQKINKAFYNLIEKSFFIFFLLVTTIPLNSILDSLPLSYNYSDDGLYTLRPAGLLMFLPTDRYPGYIFFPLSLWVCSYIWIYKQIRKTESLNDALPAAGAKKPEQSLWSLVYKTSRYLILILIGRYLFIMIFSILTDRMSEYHCNILRQYIHPQYMYTPCIDTFEIIFLFALFLTCAFLVIYFKYVTKIPLKIASKIVLSHLATIIAVTLATKLFLMDIGKSLMQDAPTNIGYTLASPQLIPHINNGQSLGQSFTLTTSTYVTVAVFTLYALAPFILILWGNRKLRAQSRKSISYKEVLILFCLTIMIVTVRFSLNVSNHYNHYIESCDIVRPPCSVVTMNLSGF